MKIEFIVSTSTEHTIGAIATGKDNEVVLTTQSNMHSCGKTPNVSDVYSYTIKSFVLCTYFPMIL